MMTDRLLIRSARTPAGNEMTVRGTRSIIVTMAVRSCLVGLAGHPRHRQQDHDLFPGLIIELPENLRDQKSPHAAPTGAISVRGRARLGLARRRFPLRRLTVPGDLRLDFRDLVHLSAPT